MFYKNIKHNVNFLTGKKNIILWNLLMFIINLKNNFELRPLKNMGIWIKITENKKVTDYYQK